MLLLKLTQFHGYFQKFELTPAYLFSPKLNRHQILACSQLKNLADSPENLRGLRLLEVQLDSPDTLHFPHPFIPCLLFDPLSLKLFLSPLLFELLELPQFGQLFLFRTLDFFLLFDSLFLLLEQLQLFAFFSPLFGTLLHLSQVNRRRFYDRLLLLSTRAFHFLVLLDCRADS